MTLRFKLAIRNKTTFIFRFIMPLINVILAIILPKFIDNSINIPTVKQNIIHNLLYNNDFKLNNYSRILVQLILVFLLIT